MCGFNKRRPELGRTSFQQRQSKNKIIIIMRRRRTRRRTRTGMVLTHSNPDVITHRRVRPGSGVGERTRRGYFLSLNSPLGSQFFYL